MLFIVLMVLVAVHQDRVHTGDRHIREVATGVFARELVALDERTARQFEQAGLPFRQRVISEFGIRA